MELSYLQIVAIVIISIASGGIFTLFIVLILNKSINKQSEYITLPQLESDIKQFVETRKVKEYKQPEVDTGEEMINQFVRPVKRENIENVRKQEKQRPIRRSILQQLKDLKTPAKVKPENNDGDNLKAF